MVLFLQIGWCCHCWRSYRDVRVFAFQLLESKQWNRRQEEDLQGSNEANGCSWVGAVVEVVEVVEEDSPKARLLDHCWGGLAVAEVHSDRRSSQQARRIIMMNNLIIK
jgi:hypothetical protein